MNYFKELWADSQRALPQLVRMQVGVFLHPFEAGVLHVTASRCVLCD